jgi:hypothetical protein
MQNSTKMPVLEETLREIALLSESQLNLEITHLLDEQPYLIGTLFQLETDCSDDENWLLFMTTLAIIKSFHRIGLPIQMIAIDQLQQVQKDIQNAFKPLLEQDEIVEADVLRIASSPITLQTILSAVPEMRLAPMKKSGERHIHIMLLMDWIITCVEHAVSKPEQTTGNHEN